MVPFWSATPGACPNGGRGCPNHWEQEDQGPGMCVLSHEELGIPTSGSLSRITRSLNSKAHPHRAGPIGCSGQQCLFNASVGMVLVPLPSCSKDPCPWSNGRRRLVPRPTKSSVTSPMGAFVMFSKRNQNGSFLEFKSKCMSQWSQRMPQSLGTGGPRARNAWLWCHSYVQQGSLPLEQRTAHT